MPRPYAAAVVVNVNCASMLSALEVRPPFLDRRKIEFGFGRVPDDLRATSREREILLRWLGERVQQASLDLTRKHASHCRCASGPRGVGLVTTWGFSRW
jgi:hypothetical protein